MEWETLKAALDLALEHGQHRIKILFSGGEPLLEFDLIEKAVAYVERRVSEKKQILFALITNGTLLTEERVGFFEQHSVNIQISFDGVKEAQDLRAEGTFNILDGLLDCLRERFPGFYSSSIKISSTVIPETVRHIADSFEYFLMKGAHRIAVAPSIADTWRWRPDRIGLLEGQWARVCESSLTHLGRTGEVPLLLFRLAEEEAGRGKSRDICAAGRGAMLAVDVDGRVYPCITMASSCQTIESPVLQKSIEAMWLGSLTGQQFWERYHRLPEAASRLPMFSPTERRYSSYRACRDCAYFAQCVVCPVPIACLQGNDDCERVPDFICAFNFTALKYRQQFLEQSKLGRRDGSAC